MPVDQTLLRYHSCKWAHKSLEFFPGYFYFPYSIHDVCYSVLLNAVILSFGLKASLDMPTSHRGSSVSNMPGTLKKLTEMASPPLNGGYNNCHMSQRTMTSEMLRSCLSDSRMPSRLVTQFLAPLAFLGCGRATRQCNASGAEGDL